MQFPRFLPSALCCEHAQAWEWPDVATLAPASSVAQIARKLSIVTLRHLPRTWQPSAVCPPPKIDNTITQSGNGGHHDDENGDDDDDDDDIGDDKRRRQRDTSAATIQARVRGMRASKPKESNPSVMDSRGSAGVQGRSHDFTLDGEEEAAAVRIEAAVRGRLTRKRLSEEAMKGASRPALRIAAPSNNATNAVRGGGSRTLNAGESAAATAQPAASPPPQRPPPPSCVVDDLAQLEVLGVVGVRAFFDSLGLGACADRLRAQRPSADGVGSIDGAELARICRAANPDAALRAAGVGARLHRVKLLSALGVGADLTTTFGVGTGAARGMVLAPSSSAVGGSGATCTSGGGGCGGGVAATPVAAIAALQMVRQLRRELLPGERGRGSADGGGRGFDGTARAAESTIVMTGEGPSLVPVLLPELEKVLSAQARLRGQVRTNAAVRITYMFFVYA